MPPEARLEQVKMNHRDYLVRAYLQPAFASTRRSQRVEVIRSIKLFVNVKREGQQQCEEFKLDGIGSFMNNPGGSGLAFTYESGAAPLMVTHDTPQAKVLVFEPKRDIGEPYFVGKHNYLLTLVAKRTTEDEPLVGTIRLLADQDKLSRTEPKISKGNQSATCS
jgi:hypothetical protein